MAGKAIQNGDTDLLFVLPVALNGVYIHIT